MDTATARTIASGRYGRVELTTVPYMTPGEYLGRVQCLLHVWDPAQQAFLLRGYGDSWEDALVDAARQETEEIAYA